MTTSKDLLDKIAATLVSLKKEVETFHKQPHNIDDTEVDTLCDQLDDYITEFSEAIEAEFEEYTQACDDRDSDKNED